MSNDFLDQFTPATIGAALLSGFLIGYYGYFRFIEWAEELGVVKRPRWKAWRILGTTILLALPYLIGFRIPQMIAYYLDGNPHLELLMARSVVVGMYLIAFAAGMAFRFSRNGYHH